VGLTNVWVQTRGDGLIRADQIVGVHTRKTPAMTGKPSHWLPTPRREPRASTGVGRDHHGLVPIHLFRGTDLGHHYDPDYL
jgi:hypothetical protein